MNAQHLRVGNYIKANGMISEIVAIAREQVDCMSVRNGKEILTLQLADTKLEPIPLDKLVLMECCGFDLSKRLTAKNIYLQYTPQNDHYIILENDKREPLIHFWDVKSLHQLQNLYYALVGAELIIALDCLHKMLV